MSSRKNATILPFSLPARRSEPADRRGKRELPRTKEEISFHYTLDLLMEDFGKKHRREDCALCEPMKVMGKHRDEVMAEFNFALFTTFFPSFEGYVSDLRETLMEQLFSRGKGPVYKNWKEKLKAMLQNQILQDVKSFLEDILKHLAKYAQVEVEAPRQKRILTQTLSRLDSEWMNL